MTIWIDAQISPAISVWIGDNFDVQAFAARDLNLRDSEDEEIFLAAKQANVVVITKDKDFVSLLERLGSPPQIIWLTCGNTSNARLKEILTATLNNAIELLQNAKKLLRLVNMKTKIFVGLFSLMLCHSSNCKLPFL